MIAGLNNKRRGGGGVFLGHFMTMKPALILSSMLLMLVSSSAALLLAAESENVGVSSFNNKGFEQDAASTNTYAAGKRVLHGEEEGEDEDPEFIIGGTELDENIWETSRRYLVSTNVVDPDDGTMEHDCTASMISRRVVLTAAHCVDKDGVFNGQNKVVKLNMYSYDDQDEVVTIPLCSIEGGGGDGDCTDLAYAIRHENFNGVLNGNDFALIILPNTSEVVEGVLAEISPVKLNSDANVPADGDDLETFGWGRISTDDEVAPPKIPNTVFLKYLEDEQECEERMVAGGGIAFEVSTSMLCTIGDGTTSAYRGDSGGPIITGGNVQVGVTSFGDHDNPTGVPTIYARVSDGFGWIKDTVCKEIPDDEVFSCASTSSEPTTAPTSSKPTTAASKSAKQSAAAKSSKLPSSKALK